MCVVALADCDAVEPAPERAEIGDLIASAAGTKLQIDGWMGLTEGTADDGGRVVYAAVPFDDVPRDHPCDRGGSRRQL